MAVAIPILTGLTVALVMFYVNKWYNRREKKKVTLDKLIEEMIQIKSLLEGHKSFSETLLQHGTEIKVRKEVCESNHKWNGIDRRKNLEVNHDY